MVSFCKGIASDIESLVKISDGPDLWPNKSEEIQSVALRCLGLLAFAVEATLLITALFNPPITLGFIITQLCLFAIGYDCCVAGENLRKECDLFLDPISVGVSKVKSLRDGTPSYMQGTISNYCYNKIVK